MHMRAHLQWPCPSPAQRSHTPAPYTPNPIGSIHTHMLSHPAPLLHAERVKARILAVVPGVVACLATIVVHLILEQLEMLLLELHVDRGDVHRRDLRTDAESRLNQPLSVS